VDRTALFVAAKESLEGYLPESLKRDLQHLRSAAAAGSEQRQVQPYCQSVRKKQSLRQYGHEINDRKEEKQ
jgi:hypothetical protein